MLDDISTDRGSYSDTKNINASEDLVTTSKTYTSGEIFDPNDLMYTPPLSRVEKKNLEDKKKSSDF